jgi:predicted HTH domain antitoxin
MRQNMSVQQITIEIPEEILLAEKTDAAAFARELPLLAAVKLYELGRLSSGRAAQLAGVPRVEFLMRLAEYQVFPLQAELAEMEAEHAPSH